ncbi:hypothetical protein [Methylotenera sp.]|uniref:hypothetical protein n=1 Tax=Methylotenera sp. TaxID=2051956 RepID=UPI0025D51B7C|nr:hypothetical protein [Methylotenera sp.]
MQLNLNNSAVKMCFCVVAAVLFTFGATAVTAASVSKKYTEDQFLNTFSGKTKKIVTEKLGAPFKKELSVKPAGATGFLGKVGADEKNSKRVNVEMWYYKNIVNYDPKHTYKETEITFVNDKVMNIAFFNNR